MLARYAEIMQAEPLTPAMIQCLKLMQSFTDCRMPLAEFYDEVDLFEERIRNLEASTLDARVLSPIADSLDYICIMSRAEEPLSDVLDYVRELQRQLADADWRKRVASGWWPYGPD